MFSKPRTKNSRSTLNGYYIHDCRKAARFCFEELLICVKHNASNRCYDIFVREGATLNGKKKVLDKELLARFQKFYPKSFNVVVLSERAVELFVN
ncbi:MAG TPA: hypothetical protein VII99_17925 [Bacteroidia bacterium]